MRVTDIDFSNILFEEKSNKKIFENVLVYDVSYKTFMSKSHCVFGLIK